jgi:hypothetical protein
MQAVSPDTEAVLSVLPPLSPSIVLSFDKVVSRLDKKRRRDLASRNTPLN